MLSIPFCSQRPLLGRNPGPHVGLLSLRDGFGLLPSFESQLEIELFSFMS